MDTSERLTRIETIVTEVRTDVRCLTKIVKGNGLDSLVVAVDRNTQARKRADRAFYLAFAAVVAAIGSLVVGLLL